VHGIDEAMVKEKPTFDKVYDEFEEFIRGSVLMAHNAAFDIGFLKAELGRYSRVPPGNSVIDSLKLFREWYPQLKSHSLESVAEHVDVSDGGFHRALADSMYVALIFDKGVHRLGESARLSDLYAESGGSMKMGSN
jgi:DNA polymerase-3 subunit alpha (Gram-positive type)